MPVVAPVVVGPVTFLYIDIDASDPTSALVTVIKDDTDTFQLSQAGTIQTCGAVIQSQVDQLTE